MRSFRLPAQAVIAATFLLVIGLGGFAIAQSSTPASQIRACAKKKGGALRVAAKCRKQERRVQWAAAGSVGATAQAGTGGAAGTNGVNGTTTGETFYAENLSPGSNFGTTCGSPSGPSITFTAPTGAYIQVMAQADLQRSSATANAVCLQVDSGSAFNVMTSVSLLYETKYLSQSAGGGGATTAYTITPFVFPVSAGSHTVSLQYSSTGGISNFRNRKLW
jgi:hypothetical protein